LHAKSTDQLKGADRSGFTFPVSDPGLVAIVESILEGAAIPYAVTGEELQDVLGWGRVGGYNSIAGPVRFEVRPQDAAVARALLTPLPESAWRETGESAEGLEDPPAKGQGATLSEVSGKRRWRSTLLGIWAFGLPLAFVGLAGLDTAVAISGGTVRNDVPAAGVAVFLAVAWVALVVDAYRSSSLRRQERGAWVLLLLMLGLYAAPFYWWRSGRRRS
jgi:hypothetical protein